MKSFLTTVCAAAAALCFTLATATPVFAVEPIPRKCVNPCSTAGDPKCTKDNAWCVANYHPSSTCQCDVDLGTCGCN